MIIVSVCVRLAVVVLALSLVGSACGNDGSAEGVPAAEPACTSRMTFEGQSLLCQVENTSWFRRDGTTPGRILHSFLVSESHTSEHLSDDFSPSLEIVCDGGSLSAYVDFVGHRVSGQPALGGRIPVYYELDGSPTDEAWDESDFNQYAFSPDPAAFAESLAASQELVFKAWNHDGSLVGTIVFDTTGADREVNRAITACGL